MFDKESYMASIGVARGVKTPRRKIEKNPMQEETSCHKKDLDGGKLEGLPLAVSFLLERPEDPKMAKPVDNLDEVPLKEDHPNQCIKISVELKNPISSQIALLRHYADVFAWTTQDIPGVNPKVMTHRLEIRPGFRLVKHKK